MLHNQAIQDPSGAMVKIWECANVPGWLVTIVHVYVYVYVYVYSSCSECPLNSVCHGSSSTDTCISHFI